MFGLFQSKPLLDEQSTQWIFDVFAWSLENFNAEFFFQHSTLVLPNNQFFPGRGDSEQGMAELIFNHVKRYAGIAHWPTRVVDQSHCLISNMPQLEINGPLRTENGQEDETIAEDRRLLIPYNPHQINNPEGMIASFAHIVAHYMGQMASSAPPGGPNYWPHVTEMLAIYLGFGLMFANSAYTFRGGCGSCYNPLADRDAYLTEQQSTYGLALFVVLKDLPQSSVNAHLKGHLRSFYKRAVKEIRQQTDALAKLQSKAPQSLT